MRMNICDLNKWLQTTIPISKRIVLPMDFSFWPCAFLGGPTVYHQFNLSVELLLMKFLLAMYEAWTTLSPGWFMMSYVLNERLILGNVHKWRPMIFDHPTYNILQFSTITSLFLGYFGINLKCFYQIPQTWWKIYSCPML